MRNANYFAVFLIAASLVLCPTATMAQQEAADAAAIAAANDEQLAQQQADTAAASQQFKNEGIFGCTANVGQSVGAMAAVGGVYVPVNDAAVTINTGILVYKMCLLDPMTRKIAENATADIAKGGIQNVVQGRGGRPQYPQNIPVEQKERGDTGALPAMLAIRSSDKKFGSSAGSNAKATQILAANYTANTSWQKRLDANACPYNDSADTPIFDRLYHMADSRCRDDSSLALHTGPLVVSRAAARQEALRLQWDWGRGFYPVEEIDGDYYRTVTPAAYVEENGLQAIQSGFRQAENVDAMGQMTTALFTGLAQQIVADSRGLSGITQSSGSQPSYLNQMTAETASDVRSNASNAALQILANARQVEAQYLQIMNNIARNLTDTITQLRTAETQCWALLIPKVQTYAATQSCTTDENGQQTCTGGFQIQPATSTAFSQAVINGEVQPLATVAINNVTASTKAVSLIDQLIAGVTTVTSLSAQRLALSQLDTLVSQRALHSQYDVTAAQQQAAAVKDGMSTLVTDTVKAWADSEDPNVGWCNYNNTAVLQFWANRWKK